MSTGNQLSSTWLDKNLLYQLRDYIFKYAKFIQYILYILALNFKVEIFFFFNLQSSMN